MRYFKILLWPIGYLWCALSIIMFFILLFFSMLIPASIWDDIDSYFEWQHNYIKWIFNLDKAA